MINECIIGNREGYGAVCDTYEEFIQTLENKSFKLAGTIVNVGDEYEFTGLLNRPLKYVGCRDGKKMWFYLGDDKGRYFFKEIAYIDETLIYISYHLQSGNSHEYKNGCWFRPGAKARKRNLESQSK